MKSTQLILITSMLLAGQTALTQAPPTKVPRATDLIANYRLTLPEVAFGMNNRSTAWVKEQNKYAIPATSYGLIGEIKPSNVQVELFFLGMLPEPKWNNGFFATSIVTKAVLKDKAFQKINPSGSDEVVLTGYNMLDTCDEVRMDVVTADNIYQKNLPTLLEALGKFNDQKFDRFEKCEMKTVIHAKDPNIKFDSGSFGTIYLFREGHIYLNLKPKTGEVNGSGYGYSYEMRQREFVPLFRGKYDQDGVFKEFGFRDEHKTTSAIQIQDKILDTLEEYAYGVSSAMGLSTPGAIHAEILRTQRFAVKNISVLLKDLEATYSGLAPMQALLIAHKITNSLQYVEAIEKLVNTASTIGSKINVRLN